MAFFIILFIVVYIGPPIIMVLLAVVVGLCEVVVALLAPIFTPIERRVRKTAVRIGNAMQKWADVDPK